MGNVVVKRKVEKSFLIYFNFLVDFVCGITYIIYISDKGTKQGENCG